MGIVMTRNMLAVTLLFVLGHPLIVHAAEPEAGQGAKATYRSVAPQSYSERTARENPHNSRTDCDARRNPEVECRDFAEQNRKQKTGQTANPAYSRP